MLPLEMLQQVASHLQTHQPSLYAFSLVSKFCREATTPFVFCNLHLRVHKVEELNHDISNLHAILVRADAARHVRTLRIKGFLCFDGEDSRALATTTYDPHMHKNDEWFKQTGLYEIMPNEEYVLGGRHRCYEPAVKRKSKEDVRWAPIAALLGALPALSTLVYDAGNQFPPCMLDAVHEHPRCRLHNHAFYLRSLYMGEVDAYELELATSPRLESVKVRCAPNKDNDFDDDFHEEAVMDMASGAAPNLKELTVVRIETNWQREQPPRPLWWGLPGFVPKSPGQRTLTSLSLLGTPFWGPDLFKKWAQCVDFNSLRSLVLGGGHGFDPGIHYEILGWITQNLSFRCVRSLSVKIGRHDESYEQPDCASTIASFFDIFESLEDLSVTGPLEPSIVNAILFRHGPSLRKLSLRPVESIYHDDNGTPPHRRGIPMIFTKEQYLQIQDQCPSLEDLTIPVKRTKSDAAEAELYRCFSKMQRLHSLFLILDCTNWGIVRDPNWTDDPSFDAYDREFFREQRDSVLLKKGHVRATLMNCAVDESLARSIFHTISESKVGVQLQSLRLWTMNDIYFLQVVRYPYGADELLGNLSRSWLLERVGVGIEVKELGRMARELRDRKLKKYERIEERAKGGPRLEDWKWESRRIFHSIWPHKEGRDWRDDWASLPLQG